MMKLLKISFDLPVIDNNEIINQHNEIIKSSIKQVVNCIGDEVINNDK